MIHHLISASPYTSRFLKLLEDHPDVFAPEEHCFWIEGAAGSAFGAGGAGRIRRFDTGAWGFLRAFRELTRNDSVIIHQLSNPRLLLYLYFFRGVARRCAWQIWGGDVYYFRYRPNTWPHSCRPRSPSGARSCVTPGRRWTKRFPNQGKPEQPRNQQ